MKTKTGFGILGVLLILAIGAFLIFYANLNRKIAKGEDASRQGLFERAEFFSQSALQDFDGWYFSKIQPLRKDYERTKLFRAWMFYYDGYYSGLKKYEMAEGLISRELKRGKAAYKDQFYNLKALIAWQKGVELFIRIGRKAAYSKAVDHFIEEARNSSAKAVKENDGKDWDIKYNYEFFRLPKQQLKQYMQQQANQKKKDREMKKKAEQISKERKIKPNQEGEKARQKTKKIDKNKKGKAKILIPQDKKKKSENEPTSGSEKKKKKKKG